MYAFIMKRYLACYLKDKSPCELGYRLCTVGRYICHRYTVTPCRIQINYVVACCTDSDILKLRKMAEGLLIEDYLVCKNHLCIADMLILVSLSCILINRCFKNRGYWFQGDVSLIYRSLFEINCFHYFSSGYYFRYSSSEDNNFLFFIGRYQFSILLQEINLHYSSSIDSGKA